MEALSNYLDRLRRLIPARSIALYMLGNALLLSLVEKPDQLPDKFGWLILVINGGCLVFNFVGGMLLDKKAWHAALISCGAFLLMALCQRFYGPLAAIGVDTQAAFVVAGFVAALYVSILPTFYRGDEAAVQAAQAARVATQRAAA
jgi:hypothetical protein